MLNRRSFLRNAAVAVPAATLAAAAAPSGLDSLLADIAERRRLMHLIYANQDECAAFNQNWARSAPSDEPAYMAAWKAKSQEGQRLQADIAEVEQRILKIVYSL